MDIKNILKKTVIPVIAGAVILTAVSDGYHAESKIIGASGDAEDWRVLDGMTYSSKTGAHTGTMPNNGQSSDVVLKTSVQVG